MAKSKPKPKRRIWRAVLIVLLTFGVFLLLFVAAFIFNPFESSLPELRDIVPRDVNFFARKRLLAKDFTTFPEPKFWSELTEARGFSAIDGGSIGQGLRRDGIERSVQQVAELFDKVRSDSGGFLDILRDVIGEEVIVAGFNMDYSEAEPRPLPAPWWCLYTRVNWRVKAIHGLAGFGFVQGMFEEQGIKIESRDDMLVVTAAGAAGPVYVKRHLDALMVTNHTLLLDKAQLLIDGNRDEEPIGRMPAYTDGTVERVDNWADVNRIDVPNVVEFVVEPNAFDGFRRFATGWPNPQNKDSMNERVLASFLNLKGWMQVTGGVMFERGLLGATGQIGLNSKQHTSFQSSFYTAEQQRRDQWLDDFLRMVPESACAAAGLRMPAGEFLHSMFDALDDAEKNLINDALRRATFQGDQLNDVRDLIDRVRGAFLPRTGFVFRRNTPDTDRDENGDLKVPVAAKSPMPQVAWVFWLRKGSAPLVEELVAMLRTYYSSFGFRKVWHLKVPFGTQGGSFEEKVNEFTNPQIPATGTIAMIVFSDFFVVSNSGPLIRSILGTRYSSRTGMRSIIDSPEFEATKDELSNTLNGMVWLSGPNLVPVLDDYLAFADADSVVPDAGWMQSVRGDAEDEVRRTKYPQYRSKASIPPDMTEPGGEFDQAVVDWMRAKWAQTRTNFSAEDRNQMQQLRGMSQMFKAAAVQVELQNNYIRYQVRLMTDFR